MAKKKRTAFDRLKAATSGVLPRPNFPISGPSTIKPPEAWHIAVRGNLDLRQHHPAWYKLIGCISDSELSEGLTSLQSIAFPVLHGGVMQFDVGDFAINVIPDRWMIQTITEANCDKIIKVASIVFEKLSEISLTAYGIHKTMILELEKRTAKQFLADQLIGSNLALHRGNSEAYLTYIEHHEDADTQIWFNPSSAGEKWLNVEHNRHHPIKDMGTSEYFDLGAMLRQNAKLDWNIASSYGAELAKAITGVD